MQPTKTKLEVVSIPIAQVLPREERRLRALQHDHVTELAESIATLGLKTPISVREEPATKRRFLVAGEHRLEACKKLGWPEIDAFVMHCTKDDARLWEIDENLEHKELSELERGEHIAERKRIYVRMNPETKHGGAPGKAGGGKIAKETKLDSFVTDTATRTGMSETAIKRSIHRTEKIAAEVKDEIRAMPQIADKGVELDALASLPKNQQKEAVQMVKAGQAKNVRQAAETINPKPKPKPKPEPEQKPEPMPEPQPEPAVEPTIEPSFVPHPGRPETEIEIRQRLVVEAAVPISEPNCVGAQPSETPTPRPGGKRQRILDNANKTRMMNILSMISGASKGIPGLDVASIKNQCSKSELAEWAAIAREPARLLRALANQLES